MMNEELFLEREEIRQQVDIFYQQFIPVHITFRSGIWMNGNIKKIEYDFFLLDEFKMGEMTIFFSDVCSIEKFKSPRRI